MRLLTITLILSLLAPASALGQVIFYCVSDGSPCAPTCLHESKPAPCPELLSPNCCASKSEGTLRSEATQEQRAPLLFAEAEQTLDLELSPPSQPSQVLERARSLPPPKSPLFLAHCSLLN